MGWWQNTKNLFGKADPEPETLAESKQIQPVTPPASYHDENIETFAKFEKSLREQVNAYHQTMKAHKENKKLDEAFLKGTRGVTENEESFMREREFMVGGHDWQIEERRLWNHQIDNKEIPKNTMQNPYVKGLDNVDNDYIDAYAKQLYKQNKDIYRKQGILADHHEKGTRLIPEYPEALEYIDPQRTDLVPDLNGTRVEYTAFYKDMTAPRAPDLAPDERARDKPSTSLDRAKDTAKDEGERGKDTEPIITPPERTGFGYDGKQWRGDKPHSKYDVLQRPREQEQPEQDEGDRSREEEQQAARKQEDERQEDTSREEREATPVQAESNAAEVTDSKLETKGDQLETKSHELETKDEGQEKKTDRQTKDKDESGGGQEQPQKQNKYKVKWSR